MGSCSSFPFRRHGSKIHKLIHPLHYLCKSLTRHNMHSGRFSMKLLTHMSAEQSFLNYLRMAALDIDLNLFLAYICSLRRGALVTNRHLLLPAIIQDEADTLFIKDILPVNIKRAWQATIMLGRSLVTRQLNSCRIDVSITFRLTYNRRIARHGFQATSTPFIILYDTLFRIVNTFVASY